MRHFGRYDPSLSAVTVFRFVDENVNVPVMCLQCDDPKCVKACPTQALTRATSGLVELNRGRCIGCKFCVQACPTGMAIHSSDYDTVLKCDLCGGDTLCATWCPTKAIVYTSVPAGSERRMAAADGLRTTALDEKGSQRIDAAGNVLASASLHT
jgi:Fe-S-cluster-containing dehydrogenase component